MNKYPHKNNDQNKLYSASDIIVNDGGESVRKRPGMYFGDVDNGNALYGLFDQAMDVSLREQMGQKANRIRVTLHSDRSLEVADNGPPWPIGQVDIDREKVTRELMLVLRRGFGVITAVSRWATATLYQDGKEYFCRTVQNDRIDVPLVYRGAAPVTEAGVFAEGTTFRFLPSSDIFPSIEFSSMLIEHMLHSKAAQNPGLSIQFENLTHPYSQLTMIGPFAEAETDKAA